MTTDEQLAVIHSYGRTNYRGHYQLNKIMTLGRGKDMKACGMGTDYDSVVDSLYRNLKWHMLSSVGNIE